MREMSLQTDIGEVNRRSLRGRSTPDGDACSVNAGIVMFSLRLRNNLTTLGSLPHYGHRFSSHLRIVPVHPSLQLTAAAVDNVFG
jgi:hypothetical protein